MVRNPFDYTHGDSGTEPSTALNFLDGAKPEPEYHDWFWTNVIERINQLFAEFDRLDADNDGVVDRADYADDADASTYKGNDIDGDGDGQVDAADHANDATTLQGLSPSELRLAVEDSDEQLLADATAISFEGDLDASMDGDGTVTVAVTKTTDTRTDVSDDGSRVVADADDINFGSNVEVIDDGDGTVTVTSDDTRTVKGNDIDGDGDGRVDAADHANDATTLQGNTPSELRLAVEGYQSAVDSDVTAISFEKNLNVSDDGDGTVTVTADNTPDTQTAVADDGARLVNNVQEIDFGPRVTATDDGDGTVTITAADQNNALTYKGVDLDDDGDGRVDAADTAARVKGNDIDSNGDGRVDEADFAADADQVDGHNVYVQSSQPSNPSDGDIWVDTS